MTTRTLLAIVAAAAAPFAVLPAAHAAVGPGTGEMAFTSFNADEDGWSMVTFVDLAANTTIYFTDNEWNGSAIGAGGAFNTGESYHQWITGASTIAAGTVIRFSATDNATTLAASVGSLTRASVSGSTNYGLSATADTVYAYVGGSAGAPTAFLTAVSSGGFSVAEGQLANTGLTAGSTAAPLLNSADWAEYTGPRSGQASFAAYAPLVNGGAWTAADGIDASGLVPNAAAFTVTPVPEPAGALLLAAGLGIVALRRRRGG